MDKLAVRDPLTTRYYMTLESPCENKKIVVSPLPIYMPNGEIITSTHTALLSKTELTIEARKENIFPGLNKALLSIGTFCDHGCQAVFDDKTVLILNNGNRKIMIQGRQDPLLNI